MSTMVWDEAGARYYETGVSKGILFPIDGSTGVPWNGLVAVNLDPQGGSLESYYMDGVKYFDKVLAEDFQATIQAITTPREFDVCEGIKSYKGGAKTPFNKREKFHMVWRTEIGSDEGEVVGHKIHIAYNNVVQPAARAYQTISDSSTMDVRSFVITATPACGRHSYFWFDSREFDLSSLEAILATGVLPKCYELIEYAIPIDGGDPPLSDCDFVEETFEGYNPGQVVDDDKIVENHETFVVGLINNGIDTTELPAGGAFAANDSAASEVGTHPVLVDDDDATYITSDDGDLGWTVGLPPLVGYVAGSELELHIRMSISGGVSEDDPDNLDADAQVHISTDAGGDFTVGGFSDGADEGMGFSLSDVDGTIVDYVVPLNMDAWVDTDIDDVVAALEAGAYLNFVGASNNNPDTTPEVRVYEASIEVLNDTQPGKFMRSEGPDTYAQVGLNIYNEDGDNFPASVTVSVDFKVSRVEDGTVGGPAYATRVFSTPSIDGPDLGFLLVDYNESEESFVQLKWFWSDTDTPVWSVELPQDIWYTAVFYWGWTAYSIKVVQRDTQVLLTSSEAAQTDTPWTQMVSYAGFVGSDA